MSVCARSIAVFDEISPFGFYAFGQLVSVFEPFAVHFQTVNIGHFDNEIEMTYLENTPGVGRQMAQTIYEYFHPQG